MIQMESMIAVADNTGARSAKMIGVLGKRTPSARIRVVRREAARILTILSDRKRA